MILFPTAAFYRAALAMLTVPLAAGPLNAALVKLIKGPFTPGSGTDMTQLLEADFDAYAPLALPGAVQASWHDYDAQAGYSVVQPAMGLGWLFAAPPAKGNTIYGFALVDASGPTIASAVFDAPTSMALQTDALFLTLQFGFVGKNNIGTAFLNH
jgi:hypothetical protein